MTVLRAGFGAVTCFVRWFACEVLPLPVGRSPYHIVAAACRLVGCGVSLGVLSVTLQMSAASHGKESALLWAGSALTAVLIGNIARELMIEMCSTVATLTGHAFHREGVTLGGRAFLEIQHPTQTWVRCECGADELSFEWTEPTGRCTRVDVRLQAYSDQTAEKPRPLIRVTTAPNGTYAPHRQV